MCLTVNISCEYSRYVYHRQFIRKNIISLSMYQDSILPSMYHANVSPSMYQLSVSSSMSSGSKPDGETGGKERKVFQENVINVKYNGKESIHHCINDSNNHCIHDSINHISSPCIV